ncbi:MAG: hypothetical protein A3F13_05910 [Gammaproteobacteria bacterium RIFCSPHIGHO2_12_FULL_40_19]|nr:MAG: hypothetical protein A3F13_05910 [Gammaproteobacteria bacterium RIFCSPHIGHO2_12_FULL_40_19]
MFRSLKKIIIRATVVVISFFIVCNITYFVLNILPQRNQIFSAVASRLLQQSVEIKHTEIEGFLFRPVFVFHDITLGQVHLHELQITLNVWRSILERQWVTEQVVIDRLHIQVHRDREQHYQISGLTTTAIDLSQQPPPLIAFFSWIGTQSEIIFSKTQVDLHHENGTYLPIENLNIVIKNKDEKHLLSAHFHLKQTVPTSLRVVAKIAGNSFQSPNTHAIVFVQGEHVNLSQWLAYLPQVAAFKKIKTLQGVANFKTWVRYANQNVQQVQSQFVLKHISYDHMTMHQLSADALWMREKSSWELQAHFKPLGVTQNAIIPGLSGGFGMFRMTPTRGALIFDGKNTQIILPSRFFQAPVLSNLFAKINWVREKKNWRIEAESIKLDNSKWHLFTQFISYLDFHQKPQLTLSGRASWNGNVIPVMRATIADLTNPTVLIQAQIKTDFSKLLDLLQESSIKAEGPVLCDIKIKWPILEKNDALSMRGKIHFVNDRVEFPKWNTPLTNVTGFAEFNDRTIFADHLEAKLFHEPLLISIAANHRLDHVSNMHIALDGAINPPEFSKHFDFPLLNQIHSKVTFNAKLMIRDFNATDFPNVSVQLGTFYVLDQWWKNVLLEITPLKNETLLRLYNSDIAGDIFFPGKKEKPIRARIHYLSLHPKKNEKNKKNNWTSHSMNPESIPALDIFIDTLWVNQRSDGRVHLETQPIQNGLAIHTLTLDSPFLKFSAKGSWILHHFQSDTTLMGRVSATDLGAVFSQHHWSSRLKNGKFWSDFSLTWPGAPYQFSMDHVIGRVEVLVKKGAILQLDSDTETNLVLGRLLNLFSLESISHLLSLDFSVLTKKGFSFDVLQGNIELSQGTLFTQAIEINGPLAKVNFQGKVSFTNQSNDLSMAVFPKVSSSLPSLIGFAGGPVVGAAAWLANVVISPTMGHLMKMNYHIGGTPNKPVVTRVS